MIKFNRCSRCNEELGLPDDNINERALLLMGVVTDGTVVGLSTNPTLRTINSDPLTHMLFEVVKDLIVKNDALVGEGVA